MKGFNIDTNLLQRILMVGNFNMITIFCYQFTSINLVAIYLDKPWKPWKPQVLTSLACFFYNYAMAFNRTFYDFISVS